MPLERAATRLHPESPAATSAEHRLLLAAASAQVSGSRLASLTELLGGTLDWRLVFETAREHGVAALCYPMLAVLGDSVIPVEILLGFRKHAMMNAARNLRLASRLVEIRERAERAGIVLIPYKGVALAQLAYGDLGRRGFVDLDFIVRQRDLVETAKLLQGLGYRAESPALLRPGAPAPGEYVFLSGETDFHVEVHTEFTLRHFPSRLSLEPLFASREMLSIAGHPVSTFSREDTLSLLAVHGSKDFWAELLWICDIAALIHLPGFRWRQAMESAERMRCRRMVNVALLLAGDVLDAQLPPEVMRRTGTDRTARELARWIAGLLFAPRPLRSWEQVRYRMRMVEGFWTGLAYAARLATTPAADDWNAAHLPGRPRFAYALLRPLRLLRRKRSP